MPKKGILERLKEGVVLGDGGYILELLPEGAWPPLRCLPPGCAGEARARSGFERLE